MRGVGCSALGKFAAIGVACAAVLPLGACRKAQRAAAPLTAPAAIPHGAVPAYSDVAERYNARVEPLRRLWSRGTMRVWYPDKQGEEETAQLDANLQFIRPDKINLTLMHIGKVEPIAVLGSNEERYWYIDLADNQRKIAKVGEHARATQAAIEQLGLPVYPLDLVELMGISALPTTWPTVGTGEGPDLRWSSDGRSLVLTTRARTGSRRMYLDPQSFLPRRIELLGPDGKPLVASELGDFEEVEGAGGAMMPFEVIAVIAGGRERVRLRLDQPAVNHTIKPIAFDADKLFAAYGVRDIESLDPVAISAP